MVMQLCKKTDIPYQVQVNRSGMPGGQDPWTDCGFLSADAGSGYWNSDACHAFCKRTGRYERLSGIGNVFENIFCIKKLQKK